MSIEEINELDQEEFVRLLGGLFEGSSWIAREAWHRRPFAGADSLHTELCNVMYEAPVEAQLALIRAHPDLVGRAALAGTLTPESSREQASAGLGALSSEEIGLFNLYNDRYRERFGFPFVICARENKKASILSGFEARLQNNRDDEIATALNEIAKIARLRLLDVLSSNRT